MKNWKEWISENENADHRDLLSQDQLDWCNRHIVENWWVNEKGEVAVSHNMYFKGVYGITEFPVQFADIEGSFYADGAYNLKSLKGSPRMVLMTFSCDGCTGLTNLEGAPIKVRKLTINNCLNLTSLEGMPKEFHELSNYSFSRMTKLPQVEKDFLGNRALQEQWKKSPLGWQKFMYTGGAAKGRKYGL